MKVFPFTRTSFTATACEMPSANIYLLWCNGVGATSLPFWGRIYSFTMTNAAGDPIRSFLPCRRIPNDTIGLYDTVEGIFYENAGTGSFVAGEVL